MKFSLAQQIEEVERELSLRRDEVYGRRVRSGRMRASHVEFHIGRLQAVLGTLQWLHQHETAVRAYVAARCDDRASGDGA